MIRMPDFGKKVISAAQREAETEEAYSKIRREAEAEVDRLLEDARKEAEEIISKARIKAEGEARAKSAGILSQAKQKAIEIEAEAVSRITQAKMQTTENIDKYLAHNTTESKQWIKDDAEKQTGPVAKEIQVEERLPELFEGKVEIVITPPINIAWLLRVTRYLGSTPGVKILQTAGSWNIGCTIGLFLDTPLPLVDLLKDMPNVKGVKVLDEQDQSTWPSTLRSQFASHWGQKRISIAIEGSQRAAGSKESMSVGWEKNARNSVMVGVLTPVPTPVIENEVGHMRSCR
jgi:hypothetical protein